MSYVVLARKWRPQSFESLTGQGHVARTLQNAISTGRIPHAMLLTGPRGVGKTSSARIIAMALNCLQGPTPTPCGECRACQEIRSGRAVDILEIDGASNRGINEIRELRDSVQYAPSKDRYKVYIIDEVHMLTTEAFNALLKTLEEPPPHVVFIFATTEPQKIPVTILSRCQRFDFRQIALPDMIERLELILREEAVDAEPEALHLIARQAAGGMRDALSLLDQIISASGGKITAEQTAELLGAADRRQLFHLSEALIERDSAKALRTLHQVLNRGTDVSWFANEFAGHLRDLAVLRVAGTRDKLAVFSDEELRIAGEQLQKTDLGTLEAWLDLMISAAEEISRSSLGTMRFELTLIRMCEIATRQSLDYIIALLEKNAGISTPLQATAAATEGDTFAAGETPARPKPEGLAERVSPRVTPNAESAPIAQAASPSAEPVPDTARTIDDRPEPEFSSLEEELIEPPTLTSPPSHAVDAPAPDTEVGLEDAAFDDAGSQDVAWDESVTADERAYDGLSLEVDDRPAPAQAATRSDAPSPSSDNALDGAMTFARWRQIVEKLAATERIWRLLASGYATVLDGTVQVALSDVFELKDLETLREHFASFSAEICGKAWDIELVTTASRAERELSAAWRIRTEEEEEREARRQQIFSRIQSHPILEKLQKRWPQIHVAYQQVEFQLNTVNEEVSE